MCFYHTQVVSLYRYIMADCIFLPIPILTIYEFHPLIVNARYFLIPFVTNGSVQPVYVFFF